MANDPTCQDSPLSTTSSVIGILTFIGVIITGLYARVQALNAILRIDDEIIQALITATTHLEEARMLEEQIIGAPNSPAGSQQEITRAVIEEMYYVGLRNVCTLILLRYRRHGLAQLAWASEKKNVIQAFGRIEALRSKLFNSLLIALWKKIDSIQGELRNPETQPQETIPAFQRYEYDLLDSAYTRMKQDDPIITESFEKVVSTLVDPEKPDLDALERRENRLTLVFRIAQYSIEKNQPRRKMAIVLQVVWKAFGEVLKCLKRLKFQRRGR